MKSDEFEKYREPLQDSTMVIGLLREELKSQKVFNGLRSIGLQDCPLQPYLGDIILPSLGLDNNERSIHDFYNALIGVHSERMSLDGESMMREAFEVYVKLRRRRGD